MTKNDLVSAMAEKAGITKSEAEKALKAFTESVTDTLKADDKLTLIGFGTFSKTHREAREGRNPATGQTMTIAAKNIAKFKPGKALEEAIN